MVFEPTWLIGLVASRWTTSFPRASAAHHFSYLMLFIYLHVAWAVQHTYALLFSRYGLHTFFVLYGLIVVPICPLATCLHVDVTFPL